MGRDKKLWLKVMTELEPLTKHVMGSTLKVVYTVVSKDTRSNDDNDVKPVDQEIF